MFTFAVITCNRLYYLMNCVKSIVEFVGLNDINLLVIDNASSEAGVQEYLSSLPSEVDIKVYKKRRPNELHRAMNYAIEYSRKRKNKYVNFIQDDYQYVYHNPDLLQWASDAFSARKDVVQLHTNMVWKYKAHKLGKITPMSFGGAKWFYLHSKAPCDNGITRVSLYNKIGLYPTNVSIHGKEKKYSKGESWFAKKCKGKHRMLVGQPNMGMIPDCAFIRGNMRHGRYFPPPGEFYLRPFDEQQRDKVKLRSNKNKLCFIEDMIVTDGWHPSHTGKHSTQKIRTSV